MRIDVILFLFSNFLIFNFDAIFQLISLNYYPL